MSQSMELPLDTRCYLCDSYYANIHQPFVIYKCFKCKKLTPYCISCEIKLQKLFGKGNFFKCTHCDKLANAEDKVEVGPSTNSNNNINLNNSFYKTPSKPFMENNIPISSIRQSNNGNNFFIKVNNTVEERKNNANDRSKNSPEKIMLSHFLEDFSNNSNNGNKQNNNMNDFSLLTSRNRLNKRFCLNESLLGKKRDESLNATEFRGFNNYRERQNSKINIRNPSRGKFKNLISMKMSKVYNNDEMANTINEYNKKNNNNPFMINLFTEKNRNNDNMKSNLFSNNQQSINLSFIDGKSTPHRLSNNSFEYF